MADWQPTDGRIGTDLVIELAIGSVVELAAEPAIRLVADLAAGSMVRLASTWLPD